MRVFINSEVGVRLTDEDWEKLKMAKFKALINGVRVTIQREQPINVEWNQARKEKQEEEI